jgi:MFS family permease
LLVASLLGIPAAFTMVVVGLRFGTLRPLTLGIALSLAGLAVLLSSASYAMYFAGGCLMGFSWAFCLPYIQSLLASLDRSGSAIAAGTSLSTLGSALGPGLAALVIGEQSYGNVFMLSVALFFLSCIGFWHSAGRQDRNRAETAA